MKKLIVLALFLLFLIGCAGNDEIVKPTPQSPPPKPPPVAKTTPVAKPTPPPIMNVKEVKNVSHYITFRTEPLGAEVINIDLNTGKEVLSFGRTPTRILVLKKTLEIDMYGVKCTNVLSNVNGLAYGKTMNEGVEYEFKFRLPGFYDEIKVERISLSSTSDTDLTLNINLTPVKR